MSKSENKHHHHETLMSSKLITDAHFEIPEYKKPKKKSWHRSQVIFICIVRFILSLIAMKLSWSCNQTVNIAMRIIFLILSLLFSEFYILYFAIYRVFLNNACPIPGQIGMGF